MNDKESVSVKINWVDLTYIWPDEYNAFASKYIEVKINTSFLRDENKLMFQNSTKFGLYNVLGSMRWGYITS